MYNNKTGMKQHRTCFPFKFFQFTASESSVGCWRLPEALSKSDLHIFTVMLSANRISILNAPNTCTAQQIQCSKLNIIWIHKLLVEIISHLFGSPLAFLFSKFNMVLCKIRFLFFSPLNRKSRNENPRDFELGKKMFATVAS